MQLTPEQIEKMIAEETDQSNDAYQAAMDEWQSVLVRLWTAFRKQPTADELELYVEQLEDIPLALLEKAVKRAIRDYKYGNVPSVHDVWEALRKELDLSAHDDIGEAIQHWNTMRWEKVVYPFGVAVETEPAYASIA